jgi:hypothetical protein
MNFWTNLRILSRFSWHRHQSLQLFRFSISRCRINSQFLSTCHSHSSSRFPIVHRRFLHCSIQRYLFLASNLTQILLWTLIHQGKSKVPFLVSYLCSALLRRSCRNSKKWCPFRAYGLPHRFLQRKLHFYIFLFENQVNWLLWRSSAWDDTDSWPNSSHFDWNAA